MENGKIVSGTFARVWQDGTLVLEGFGLETEITTGTESWTGKGFMKFKKMDNRLRSIIAKSFKENVVLKFEILAELEDSKKHGAERILYKNVVFKTLRYFESDEILKGNKKVEFVFTDYKYFDLID